MGAVPRIAFAVAALVPLVLLQGIPESTPRWMGEELAGVPGVIRFAMAWFGLMVVASWVPLRKDDQR